MRNTVWGMVRILGVAFVSVALASMTVGCGGEEEEDALGVPVDEGGDEGGAEEGGAEEGGAEEGGAEEGGAEEGGGAGFAAVYESPGFVTCGNCHAPDAPGFAAGVEATQDWTDADTALASLQGTASGLIGNFEACNGVPLIGDTPETSLLVASLDEDIRANFAHPDFPDCTGDDISDMTVKSPGFSEDDLAALKAWITAGGTD